MNLGPDCAQIIEAMSHANSIFITALNIPFFQVLQEDICAILYERLTDLGDEVSCFVSLLGVSAVAAPAMKSTAEDCRH